MPHPLRCYLLTAVLGLGLAPVLPAAAQTILPVSSQTPASLKWYEVRTPHFRVLYPTGFEATAQRTANRLEQVYQPVSASLQRQPRPISIVLQSQNTIGNGFVTILPRHSEFYGSFPQDPFLTGTLDWLDELSLHEYRHVVQYEKARQSLGQLAYGVAGYGGVGLLTLGLPDWFFEGDAVGTETALSRSGRGRIPYFDIGLRANLLAGRKFSYSKAVAGSYRDNVPNHYVLGYFLTTRLKRTAGPTVWSDVLNRYFRFPVYPFSFSDKVRRQTGLRVDDLYQRTMQELDSTWRQEQARLELTLGTDLRQEATERVFTEYQYPQYLTDSTVLAVKSGLGHIPQLVQLSRGGQERQIQQLGLWNNPEMLSVGGGKVAWVEYRYDPRWQQRVYSELRILDVATGTLTRPGRRTRYAAAVLSPDGQQLLTVSTDSAYQQRVHVVNAQTGAVLRTFPNPENYHYLQPRWTADGRSIAAVRLERAGKAIVLLDAETGQARTVLPASNDNLSHPQPFGEYVLFNSPRSGIDNVYAVHTRTGEVRQVTSRPIGAYHAAVSPDGQRLAFHEFRAQGSRVVEMPLEPAQWRPVPALAGSPNRYAAALAAQDPGAALVGQVLPGPDSVATAALPVSRYRRLPHALNGYSWGLVQSASGSGLVLGVRSEDVLSTTQAIAGVSYDGVERTGSVSADVSYQGLWPVLDAGVAYGQRRTTALTREGQLVEDTWQYTRLTAGARLPLLLTHSRMQQALTVSGYYQMEQVRGYDLLRRPFTEVGFGRSLHALTGSMAYSRTLRQSKRDVGPRWGQTASVVWRGTPFGSGLEAEQRAAQASVYLPGIGQHHSIRLRGGYQWQPQGQPQTKYMFGGLFYPRGLNYVSLDKLSLLSAEYRLPLADVHWELGRWLYVQRLKGVAFYDRAHGSSEVADPAVPSGTRRISQNDYSTGFDLSFVFNPLRLRTPLEAGVRTFYNSQTKQWELQGLVLNVGF
ncbi:WD40-like Beta Propeller Repeat [Hymenobacter gelipurpurascens]|uniref:WD40-like Beta Propeller Repeat n=1 Tax=Hymenobacter gelipurpurascens TaxID=89968 RepID=A0A212UD34_9BACT|nr:hypothetical protein [Hymenobacter gelipurpurascens]SNC76011.1 WD40-like Beta Propeller Repeat [Hymenobacter gelipurpurascens]